jgi:hypothetical protein
MSVKRVVQVICLVYLVLVVVACNGTPTPTPVTDTPTPTPVTDTPTPTPSPVVRLSSERGQVRLERPEKPIEMMRLGHPVSVRTGDEITTDDNGLGVLTVVDSLRVEILPSTILQVKAVPEPDAPSIVKLHLLSGAALQQLQRQGGQQLDVTIETDSATIHVESRPCQIYVEDNGVTRVVVLYGGAKVEAQDKKVVLRSGQATSVKPYETPSAPDTAALWPIEDWVNTRRDSVKAGSVQTVLPTLTPTPTSTITPTPTQTPTSTPTSTPTIPPTLPANVRLVSPLKIISNAMPFAGDTITATFAVRNFGGQPFKAAKFLVKGRGPGGSNKDFGPIDDFSLASGKVYTYTVSRVLDDDSGEYEFTPFYSPDGKDIWFDITWPNDERDVVTITVESLPVVEVDVEPSTINQGDTFAIRVIASDHIGVQSIRWRSEDTGSEHLDEWTDANCDGEGDTRCEKSWSYLKWTGKDGEFPIYVEAFDTAGLSSGQVSETIIVKPTFSLSIGGGAFTKESVQSALGFGINWRGLPSEIGEVVLVDFLSGETLPGPTEMTYRPESANELLAGAGYPNGFDAVLLFVSGDELAGKLADSVAGFLSVVRIRPEKLLVDQDNARSEFSARITAGKSGLLIERRY